MKKSTLKKLFERNISSFKRNLTRIFAMVIITCFISTNAFAWGWWWAAAVATATVIGVTCLTGGVGTGPAVYLIVTGSSMVGGIGTATKGDSFYDDIVNSPSNPVGGSLMFQQPVIADNHLTTISVPGIPPGMLNNMNEGLRQFADAAKWSKGIRESCRRYYGAYYAGNVSAQNLQAQYVADFLILEETAAAQGIARIRQFSNDLRTLSPPQDSNSTTAAEYILFRDDVIMNGLPVCIDCIANQLNLTPSEKQGIRNYIVNTTNSEIYSYFSLYPPMGAYAPDLLNESMNQWEAQPMRNAIPLQILNSITNMPTLVNVNLIMEGYYNSVANSLNSSDTARAYLRRSTSPFALVDSAKSVVNSGTLMGNFVFKNAASGSYYIVGKHRNCIETWSRVSGFTLTKGHTASYNFTNPISQAFGNNMIKVDNAPSRFAFYSGDVNNDGIIDGTDVAFIDNDAANFLSGYRKTDLNGDNFIDGSDAVIADNNASNFVSRIRP